MIISTIDHSGFSAGIAGLIQKARLNAGVVVTKEMGELVKTLVRITPPKEPTKTRASIKGNVMHRFEQLGENQGDFAALDRPTSGSGVKWYAASTSYLFGAAAASDMRKADQRTLLNIYYRAKSVQRHRRIVVPIRGRKTRQRAAIITQVFTTKKQVRDLTARITRHVGRLKAAWLPIVRDGLVKITGAYMPPDWVTRHVNLKTRGTYSNGLGNRDNPSLTVTNQGKDAGKQFNEWIIGSALDIRAKAMAENVKFFLSGKKQLSDYAKN